MMTAHEEIAMRTVEAALKCDFVLNTVGAALYAENPNMKPAEQLEKAAGLIAKFAQKITREIR